jgi:23S rRNA pseudouridine2605 synthase
MDADARLERLQRILAAAGIASRRNAEQYILDGRVTVNGEVVNRLGAKADPAGDDIRVDGKPLRPQVRRYLLLNKPEGYITTTSDERGRQTVMELIQTRERLYPVGRLDRDTEGLLLLTNDGLVAHRVMHPSFELDKEYEVLTPTRPDQATLDHLRKGVRVDGKIVRPSEARILRESTKGFVLRVTLHEGLHHVVRKMMSALGIPVLTLRRTRIGPLSLAGLPVGASRDLRQGELASLMEALKIEESVTPESRPAKSSPPDQVARGRKRPRSAGP